MRGLTNVPIHESPGLSENSPYLLQHATIPVDWYPWGPEALARAKQEQKPIFLSIGYSACHWCHVMEHESFENPAIARLMNEHFVCIKVDREERPDLDQIYMSAVQMMTGRGGWPMSVFLTPDLQPFYGGTYWPPSSRMGMPGFDQVLLAVADAWKNRRAAGDRTGGRVDRAASIGSAQPPVARGMNYRGALIDRAGAALERSFDHHQRRIRRRAEISASDGFAAAVAAVAAASTARRAARW